MPKANVTPSTYIHHVSNELNLGLCCKVPTNAKQQFTSSFDVLENEFPMADSLLVRRA
jgi:hypothetical protein